MAVLESITARFLGKIAQQRQRLNLRGASSRVCICLL